MNEVGVRLRKLRGKRTPRRIAQELGITQTALEAYEQGKRVPRDEVRLRAALYYGVPLSFLREN